MALADLTSPDAVRQAARECDELGREAFLEKYGFRPAHRYFVVIDDRAYDSKAIAAVAHGIQFPELGTLSSKEFSGGRNTVARKLQQLGFEIIER